MQDDIEAALQQLDPIQNANPFWARLIRKGKTHFGGEDLQSGSNRESPEVQAAFAIVDRIRAMSDEVDAIVASEGAVGFSPTLFWLQQSGRLDEVLNFLDGVGISVTTSSVRNYLYARRISELSEVHVGRPATILEIGGGAGQLAHFNRVLRPWKRYVLVDLPPMLGRLYDYLRRKLPDATFTLNVWPDESPASQVIMLDSEHIDLVPDGVADIALNFNSFMEMDDEVRDRYIAFLYRALRAKGLFYNVNRRQLRMTRRDGSVFDSHPMLYPYRSDDRILEYDLDYVQQDVRSGLFRGYHGLPMSRIAIVKPSEAD